MCISSITFPKSWTSIVTVYDDFFQLANYLLPGHHGHIGDLYCTACMFVVIKSI